MRKLKNYPLNDTVKIDSIAHMIELCADKAGDKTAFMFKTGRGDDVHTRTYAEFADDVLALERGLSLMGIKKTHISIISENSYRWINVFISVLKSDSVFVPIDKDLPFDDVLYVAKHSDCRVLFFSKKYKKYIADIMEKIPEIEYYIGLDEEEDDGRVAYSVDDHIAQFAQRELSGDEAFGDKRIHHSYYAGFRRRDDAAVNAAQHDDGDKQCPFSVPDSAEPLFG